jgi:hypothetical protein
VYGKDERKGEISKGFGYYLEYYLSSLDPKKIFAKICKFKTLIILNLSFNNLDDDFMDNDGRLLYLLRLPIEHFDLSHNNLNKSLKK